MGTKLSHLKEQAISLRKEGFSYGHIKKSLNLKSKGTISYWLKNVILPERSIEKLKKNTVLATKRGLLLFNSERSKKIIDENKAAYLRGFQSIPKLNSKDLFIIGTTLYWGEGTKTYKNKSGPRFSFANSDPKMIIVCLRFIREILQIDDSKIRGGIHLYPNTDIVEARKFWSKITKLPVERFYIITQTSRAGQNLRKKVLPYGTIHIKVNSRAVFFKMKGFIDGLIKNLTK